MSSAAFLTAINRVLGAEGGYVNDPLDPGGETNWGISKRSYPNVDIKALTRDGAIAIYEQDFWMRVGADSMHETLAFQALDFAVNSGVETAVRKLQEAAGVADDGWWGPVTQKAVAALPESVLMFRFISTRLTYMTKLSNWQHDGRGWAVRIALDLNYAAEDLLVEVAK